MWCKIQSNKKLPEKAGRYKRPGGNRMNKKTAIVSVQMNMMGLMCGMAMCGMIFCVEKIADQNHSCMDCE